MRDRKQTVNDLKQGFTKASTEDQKLKFIEALEGILDNWKEANKLWDSEEIDPYVGNPYYPFEQSFDEYIEGLEMWIFAVRNDLGDECPKQSE